MGSMPRDSRTRYQRVFARHSTRCALERDGAHCTCKPSYYGVAWDRAQSKPVRTRRFPNAAAARSARANLIARLDRGEAHAAARGLRLSDARKRFVRAAREGRALNKRGPAVQATGGRSDR
jgi:hypothetical protein